MYNIRIKRTFLRTLDWNGVFSQMSERFTIENGYYDGGDRPIIYDDEVLDDYYFCGDLKDFKDLCKLLNELNEENKKYKKIIKKVIANLPLDNGLRKRIIEIIVEEQY